MNYNINELSIKLKDANNNIIKLNNNLIIKEELNKKNEKEYKEQINELKIDINEKEKIYININDETSKLKIN